MLHDFTSDSTSLIRVFSKQPAREAPEIDTLDAGDRPLDCPMCDEAGGLSGFLLGAAQDLSNLVTKTRIEMSAAALETIAHRLAGVQGRKNLIWVSSGFPLVLSGHLGVEQMNEPVDRATRAANDANVAIYPVDARGLVVNQMPSVMTSGATFGNTGDLPPRPPSRTVSFDSAKMLAADTGGRAFFNTNDIASAVRGALDDGRLTYVLGYYPSHGKWNGAFRTITVKVNRPGVEVRHRLGYAALPLPAGKTAAQTRTDALLEQARSPLEATAHRPDRPRHPGWRGDQPRRHDCDPRGSGRDLDLARRRQLVGVAGAGDRAEHARRPGRQERGRRRGRGRAGRALRTDHDEGLQLHPKRRTRPRSHPSPGGPARSGDGRDRIADPPRQRSGFTAVKIS